MNPYEVLGVEVGASLAEIRAAYVRLARLHHPDRHAGDPPHLRAEAGRRMQEVNEAWVELRDDDRRRAHERARFATAEPATFRPFSPDDDEPDPRLAPDVPYRPTRPPTVIDRLGVVVPVGLFGLSVLAFVLGAMTRSSGFVVVAGAAFVLSCVGFLVLPLLALGRAARGGNDGS